MKGKKLKRWEEVFDRKTKELELEESKRIRFLNNLRSFLEAGFRLEGLVIPTPTEKISRYIERKRFFGLIKKREKEEVVTILYDKLTQAICEEGLKVKAKYLVILNLNIGFDVTTIDMVIK